MTITLTGTQTGPDTWSFTVAGVDPVVSPTFTIDYGDGSAVATITTHPSGTTTVTHTYTDRGHHTYTVTARSTKTAYATTLLALAQKGANTTESMFASAAGTSQVLVQVSEYGQEITPTVDGWVTAIRFYRLAGDSTTTRGVNLWRKSDKANLVRAVSAAESGATWVTVTLASPVLVKANTTYVASYNANPNGTYRGTGGPPPSTAAHLTQGASRYSPVGQLDVYPTGSNPAQFFFVDVVFVPAGTTTAGPAERLYPANPTGWVEASTINELGDRVTVSAAGRITAVWLNKATGDTVSSHKFNLWTYGSPGTRITSYVSSGETASGWQRFPLPIPWSVTPGEYVISYGVSNSKCTYKNPHPVVPPTAHLTSKGGVYSSGVADAYPGTADTSAYGVDLEFEPTTYAPLTLQRLADDPRIPRLLDIPSTVDEAVPLVVTVDVGAATIWAEVITLAGQPIPVIDIHTYVNNPETVSTWTITRNASAGGSSTSLFTGTGDTFAIDLIDYTAPLGVPVTYTLTVNRTDYTTDLIESNAVTITGTTGCWLTNPITGTTLPVELQSWPTRQRAARRAVLEVMARADPVALSDVHTLPSGTWTFITHTDAARRALVDLLTASALAVLRPQPGSSIEWATVSVGDITERRYSGAGGDQRRFIEVDAQEIGELPATALPAPSDLQGLAVVGEPDLATLATLRQTLLQLSMIVTGDTVGAAHASNV